jgi:hypothetical protein
MYAARERGSMIDPATGEARQAHCTLSLVNLVQSLRLKPDIQWQSHNAGNDAYMTLFAMQKLLSPDTTTPTVTKPRAAATGPPGMAGQAAAMHAMPLAFTGYLAVVPSNAGQGSLTPTGTYFDARMTPPQPRLPGRVNGVSTLGAKSGKRVIGKGNEEGELGAAVKGMSLGN